MTQRSVANCEQDLIFKKAYTTPVLVIFGKVSELTAGSTSAKNDPGGSTNGGQK